MPETARDVTKRLRDVSDALEPDFGKSSTLKKDELRALCDEHGLEYDDGDTSAVLRAALAREVIGRSGTSSVDQQNPFTKDTQRRLIQKIEEAADDEDDGYSEAVEEYFEAVEHGETALGLYNPGWHGPEYAGPDGEGSWLRWPIGHDKNVKGTDEEAIVRDIDQDDISIETVDWEETPLTQWEGDDA